MRKDESEKAKPPPKPRRKKDDMLTPEELASLKKDMKQSLKYMKGKFKDLA